jgi:transcriptional regulator GlxA family with amidase domain
MVRQIGLADSRMSQIGRSVRWLRNHFSETIRVEDLAEIACMSVTSLHRHFRNVTSMTPIQYQKQLRLQAARTRLMATKEDVSEVGFVLAMTARPNLVVSIGGCSASRQVKTVRT